MGAPESPKYKNSTEGGVEAFSTRGESGGVEKVDDEDGEHRSSLSPSALQHYSLSDGVLLVEEATHDDGDLTVSQKR